MCSSAPIESAIYALGTRAHAAQFQNETPALAAALARAVTFQKTAQEEAVQLHAHFSKPRQTWTPSDFGFVLSLEEIETLAIRSLDRAAAANPVRRPPDRSVMRVRCGFSQWLCSNCEPTSAGEVSGYIALSNYHENLSHPSTWIGHRDGHRSGAKGSGQSR
jgi:hypothetical protein